MGGSSESNPKELFRYAFISSTDCEQQGDGIQEADAADIGTEDEHLEFDLFAQAYPIANLMLGLGSITNHGGKEKANIWGYALGKIGKFTVFKAMRDIQE